MDETVSFGQWLKRARRARDLSREALAELVSCAPPTLAKIEQGSRRPSRELAALLTAALGVPPDERDELLRLARRPLAAPAPVLEDPEPARAPPALAQRTFTLPAAPAPLIGRASELADVLARLADPACRLLTLAGPGGVGKTRLALQAAAGAGARFGDGAAWVDLAALEQAEHVAPTIADALGCALAGADSPDRQLLAWLRERRQLIVLDNFEHLLDAAPLLAAIIRQAPGVTLLVTSRERLRLQAEWVIELHGLAFPDNQKARQETGDRRQEPEHLVSPVSRLPIVELERYDAALLFLARARQASADFALTPANRQAVARICRQLDGMPLGIELAAAWTRVLSCQEIADEIARSLDFLSRADRDAPARHHSMRAVFDHSWRLLSEPERRALAALSVFRGGCRLEAAAAVCGEQQAEDSSLSNIPVAPELPPISRKLSEKPSEAGAWGRGALWASSEIPFSDVSSGGEAAAGDIGRDDVRGSAPHTPPFQTASQFATLNLLAALVDKSLLRAAPQASATRYDLHALIQQYAAERLSADMAAQQAVAARHARYYAALLERRLPDLLSAGRVAATAELEPDMDNLRHAWAWAAGQRDAPLLGMMAQALQALCEDRGWLQEGAALFGQAAEALGSADTAGAPHEARVLGQALGRHGYFLSRCGQFDAAWERLQASLALLRGQPSLELADTLANLGFVAYQRGEYAAAHGWLSESVAIAGALGVRFYEALGLCFLGMVALAQGHDAEAGARFEQALAIERANGQPRGLTVALGFLGRTALAQGRIADAQTFMREALLVSSHARDRWGMGYNLHHLGGLALAQGDATEARYLQHEAADIFAALGERHAYAQALASLGEAALALDDVDGARQAFGEALELAIEARLLPVGLHALFGVARLHARERPAEAYALLVAVSEHTAADQAVRARAQRLRAEVAGQLPAEARDSAEQQARERSPEQLMRQARDSIAQTG